MRSPKSRVSATLAVLLVTAAFGGKANQLCDQAAHLFFNRHLAPGNLDSAYTLLAGIRRTEPADERCLYLWSRIHVRKGDQAKSKGDKIAFYERAKAIADTLKATNPNNPDGWMWWAVAQGRIGQTRGVMNSLFMVPNLKKSFSRVLELDSTNATAYDAFGVLYYELPGIAGGSLTKSEEYLLKGLKHDPNYTVLRLDLAKVYVKQKRWTEAEKQLEALIATTTPTCPADFVLDDKPEALELLKKIRDR